MKPETSRLLVWVLAFAIAGFAGGWISGYNRGIVTQRVRSVSFDLSRNLVLADLLRKGESNGVAPAIEMDIDSALITLHGYKKSGMIDEAGRSALARGIAYRRQVPYSDMVGPARRSDAVRLVIQKIIDEGP